MITASSQRIGRREYNARRSARADRRLIGVDHRIGQPADPAHQRHRAIAQPVKLGQPAWLEPRRHEHHV
jgi:citrate synthase